ncbi:MAG: hypothetical protein COY47_07910, partial [Chloroflexi bacterium CG_4_10_14_0_8_um_filter_57_5]
MSAKSDFSADAALQRIIESARRLGVELKEADALQWMTAMAASHTDQDISVDIKSGVYGAKFVLLDFSPQD